MRNSTRLFSARLALRLSARLAAILVVCGWLAPPAFGQQGT
jgi:hypothetical protein